MPGDPWAMQEADWGAGYGYAPAGAPVADVGGSSSHTSFVIWLVVLTAGSLIVLHGLRLGGFTFVFRR